MKFILYEGPCKLCHSIARTIDLKKAMHLPQFGYHAEFDRSLPNGISIRWGPIWPLEAMPLRSGGVLN